MNIEKSLIVLQLAKTAVSSSLNCMKYKALIIKNRYYENYADNIYGWINYLIFV